MAHPSVVSLMFDFLNTASALEHRLDRALSFRGISFSEYKLLSVLAESSQIGTPRAELAARVGLTPSAITRALKPLEKLGYIDTARNQRDARQSLAIITSAGLELQKNAHNVVSDVLRELSISSATSKQILDFRSRLTDIRSLKP